MNFNFASIRFEIPTICDKSGHSALKPYKLTLPAKHIGKEVVPEGMDLGACDKCSGVARSVGVILEFLPGGKMNLLTNEQVRAREEAVHSGPWQVQFTRLNLKSATINTGRENLKGDVSFRLWKQGDTERRHMKSYHALVGQASGGNHEFEIDPIGVRVPEEIKRSINYQEFRDAAEEYLRAQFGVGGQAISTPDGAPLGVSNVAIETGPSRIYTIQVVEGAGGGW